MDSNSDEEVNINEEEASESDNQTIDAFEVTIRLLDLDAAEVDHEVTASITEVNFHFNRIPPLKLT